MQTKEPGPPLAELLPYLSSRIRGQAQALKEVAEAVARAEMGYAPPGRPKSSILMLGPTGVGKTESILSVARFLYGTEAATRIHRFDMAEFQVQESLGLLLGSSLSEEGVLGRALDAINAAGGGILLFDEIEKAHRDLAKVFLGMMDAARVRMANGVEKDCSRAYLFFTSNLGSHDAIRMENLPYTTIRRRVQHAAQSYFSPELYARFSALVVFNRLSLEVQMEIAEDMIRAELGRLEAIEGRQLRITEDVSRFLRRVGYDRYLGARPMRKAVETHLANALVSLKLAESGAGQLEGSVIQVSVSGANDRLEATWRS